MAQKDAPLVKCTLANKKLKEGAVKLWRVLLKIGWVLYIVSFFMPVVRDGETLADGVLPGWQALSHALRGEESIWGVASALTNILMLSTLIYANNFPRAIKAACVWAGRRTLSLC